VTQEIRKYRFIDALRGYSILGVLLVHSSQAVQPASPLLQALMSQGARGVQLFFITSALTLSLSWNLRRTEEASSVRNFYLRRLFRIAPMFYVAISLYSILYGFSPRYWAPNGIEWWFLPLTAFFVNGYFPQTITSVVPGGWSIAVEMNFYLVLPLMLRYLTTWKTLTAFLAFTVALSLVTRVAFRHAFEPHFPADQQYLVSSFTFFNFFAQLPIFSAGLIIASLLKSPAALKRLVVYGGSAMALAVVISRALHLLPYSVDNYVFIGMGLAIFTAFLALNPNRWLVNEAIVRIGKISFSMYLTQFAVIEFFSRSGLTAGFPAGDLSCGMYYLIVVAATASVSYVFYRAIETPGIHLGKRLIDYLERRDPASAQQASRP
jgi:peptidoglycan/LPS O-acetylase OafA/YrhL